MEKTLKGIQVFAKIGQVISKIVYIFCSIGAVGCIIGIIALAVGYIEPVTIGNVTIRGLIEKNADINLGTMYAGMIVGFILCACEAVLARMAETYFKNELAAGTPFTLSGADELFRLGIKNICISIGAVIAAGVAYAIVSFFFEEVADMSYSEFNSVGFGIGCIFVSLICKYGAQMTEKQEATDEQ